ncbi:MAG: hypothetical protein PQ612_10000 [Rickettsiales bacterium]|nr:hypothetical protein [Pseudomonadota bacterium]MDA0967171.1 hypothetical protein [Pseudomonadota bacterium]MDG4544356.1 hypothetical protein [Rickettsiales bacterium]MDG4546486.1 hypothetical protein [Rickettsiales bacterium]MDG4548632.1 hypothetical protein [Rickettsiales bacterium]
MKKIYSILLIIMFLPRFSAASDDPCIAYLDELKKHSFITYTVNDRTIDYVLRFRNGGYKEFTGFCKSNVRGENSIELTEYISEYDVALFKVTNGYAKEPMNISYLLIDIKNGGEQAIKSMTQPILSPDRKRIVTDFTKELAIYNIGNGDIKNEYKTPEQNNMIKFGDTVYSISTLNYLDDNNQVAAKASEGWISNNEIKFQHFKIGVDTDENYKEQLLILTDEGWKVK